MATDGRRGAWWSIGWNAVLVVLNVVLIGAELFRDDMRWWRFLISGVLVVVGGTGFVAGLDRLRTVRSDAAR